MAVLDEDFGTDLTLAEVGGGIRSSPAAELVRAPRDWRPLYEQAHARAERERGELPRVGYWGCSIQRATRLSGKPCKLTARQSMAQCCP